MKTLTPVDSTSSKHQLYQQICGQLQHLLGSEKNFVANAANTAALLFHSLPDVNWVGFYIPEGDELVLGPFQGKPACVRIPFGKGVCGTAAAEGRSIIVPDVSRYPGHIVCDPHSMSELVVPLMNWGRILGVLDLDSSSLNRFDEDDCEGIETVASVFVASQATNDLPDLSDTAAW